MVSVSELWNTWKEGFANKDSSKLAELLTDDFQFVGATTGRNETKQNTLDRVNANPRSWLLIIWKSSTRTMRLA